MVVDEFKKIKRGIRLANYFSKCIKLISDIFLKSVSAEIKGIPRYKLVETIRQSGNFKLFVFLISIVISFISLLIP